MESQADNEVLEQDEPADQLETEETTGETLAEGAAEGESNGEAAPGDDEVVISFEGEAPASDEVEKEAAPAWVKELRKADREKAKRIRELEAQVAAKAQAEQPAAVAKPTLADCDFDEDVFEEKLTAYHESQRAAKAAKEKQEAEAKAAQEAWNARLSAYQEAKAKLPVANFEEVEDTVKEAMSSTQLAIIVSGADKPEHLVYAIGSNAAKLKELASIKDPVKFAFAVARLETKLTVAPKKAAPAPEKVIRGSATATGVTDTKLARLEAEADRTGDRTQVLAYRRELRNKAG
jgi:hypothetical protein